DQRKIFHFKIRSTPLRSAYRGVSFLFPSPFRERVALLRRVRSAPSARRYAPPLRVSLGDLAQIESLLVRLAASAGCLRRARGRRAAARLDTGQNSLIQMKNLLDGAHRALIVGNHD